MLIRRDSTQHLECIARAGGIAANPFRGAAQERHPLPTFAAARARLPEPVWHGRPEVIACYWRAWELAFANLRRPQPRTPFIANFIDTAFNGALFLWDSVFILEFARLGRHVFDFQRTLDNLYAVQWEDGFITRELRQDDGGEQFHRHDPPSTGPNLLAWSEWRHFQATADRARLGAVLPALAAYHRWMRLHRTWGDGSYWHCGLACGMDNMHRFGAGAGRPPDPDAAGFDQGDLLHVHHGWMTWVDACFQALLSARAIAAAAQALGRTGEVADIAAEAPRLSAIIHGTCWDAARGFYTDRDRHGRTTGVVCGAGLWALADDQLPVDRLERICAWLDDPAAFNRPHRLPSLPANHPAYVATGDYWNGAVWPPLVAMTLAGLHAHGRDALAHAIACNHVEQVTAVHGATGTLWENYASETAAPGQPAKGDFVGWGGYGPIAALVHSVLGLRPDAPAGRLVFDVRLLAEHGCRRLPVGDATVDVVAAARADAHDEPQVTASADRPLAIEVRWPGGMRVLRVGAAGG